jgi:inosine/xanthosine triphosphatase
MRVVVGSENPVKVAAADRAVPDRLDATVASAAVDSGVAEQPRGRAETVTGARNRAAAALEAEGDLGVGIEGGVAPLPQRGAVRNPATEDPAEREGVTGSFLIMWAAVTDGQQWGVGSGPSLRLPDPVAARVRDGEELGPVMDDLLDTDGIARRQGAAGALTDGIVDRESALVHAVAGALGPFVTDHY